MRLAFDQPTVLLFLILVLPALRGAGAFWATTPSLSDVPSDRVSVFFDWMVRIMAAIPLAALTIGAAGLHGGGQSFLVHGTGAHVAIVLDRSLSMDEGFSLRGEKARETKTRAATRMLMSFLLRRPHDSFALVAFSTSPIQTMPLTSHRAAIAAAIAAMDGRALANTDIGAGIAIGLAQFSDDDRMATRVILLVSDGAGAIPAATRDYIRAEAIRQKVHIYYLYLRAGDDPPLAEVADGNLDLDRPAGLSVFLKNLGVPYEGFEARVPGAVDAAAARIDALETRPLSWREFGPRTDYDLVCYRIAAVALLIGMLLQFAERDLDHAPRGSRK